jgi:hypothetical protein
LNIHLLGFALGIALAAIPFALALRLSRAALKKSNKIESKRSARRAGSLLDALRGRARTRDDWMPDGRVKGGMIYNRKDKRIEVSGRLSDDTLHRVFR